MSPPGEQTGRHQGMGGRAGFYGRQPARYEEEDGNCEVAHPGSVRGSDRPRLRPSLVSRALSLGRVLHPAHYLDCPPPAPRGSALLLVRLLDGGGTSGLRAARQEGYHCAPAGPREGLCSPGVKYSVESTQVPWRCTHYWASRWGGGSIDWLLPKPVTCLYESARSSAL